MNPEHTSHKSLLDLPPEVRNRIYHNLLPVGRYYGIYPPGLNTVRDLQSLSQVNRQLRHETLPMFFGNTECIISIDSRETANGALRWLSGLKDWQAALIYDFTFVVRNVIEVHFTAHSDPVFQRSGVKLQGSVDLPPSVDKVKAEIEALLDSIRPPVDAGVDMDVGVDTGMGDSGLRVFHIEQMFKMVLTSTALKVADRVFVKRSSDPRRTGTCT